MPSRTYVAQRLGAFAGLVQSTDLAGYRMEPLPQVTVRDHYFDTEDGDLLRQGLCLRLREQDGETRAVLRPVRPEDGGPHVEAKTDRNPLDPFVPDPGPMRDALASIVGGDAPGSVTPLAPLLQLRQYRTPRVAYDGARLVGVLSFDVVVLELPDGPHAANELTIELADSGVDLDLHTLDPFLRAEGLALADLSTFERGVAQLPRSLTEPLLLLPHERDVLEALAESDNPLHRRRASVLLLDARGYRSATIANQVGLSTARVRHWKQLFREQRMLVFQAPKAVPLANRPPYRVSEIVTGGPGGPFTTAAFPRPAPEAPTETPDEPAPTEPAAPASGDGARDEAPAEPPPLDLLSEDGDIDDLLDLFQPQPTDTPVLTSEAFLSGGDEEEPLAPPEPSELPSFASIASALPPEEVDERSEPTPPADAQPSTPEAPVGQAHEGYEDGDAHEGHRRVIGDRPAVQRPRLNPDDRLVDASLEVLAYHFGQVGWCAADLDRPHGIYRLYLAVHRVRLSLEVFEPVLPTDSVSTLHRGLRRLAAALDRAMEHQRRAELAPEDEAAADAHREAVAAVRELLQGRAFGQWIGQAQRLVDSLAAQKAAGAEAPDHSRPEWDDYAGDPSDLPGRTRVRHLLGSALWSRMESILAWRPDGGPPDPRRAYHVALACSGLRFTLGLAGAAAPGPVREANAALDAAERRLIGLWRDGERMAPEARAHALEEAWAILRGDGLRRSLAAVLESL